MVCGLGGDVSLEGAGKSAVGSAIGVNHKDRQLRPVEADRFSQLIEEKVTIRFMFGRSEAFGASRYFDRIGVDNALALQIFSKPQLKTIVEAPDDGGIALVLVARSVGVVDLNHS